MRAVSAELFSHCTEANRVPRVCGARLGGEAVLGGQGGSWGEARKAALHDWSPSSIAAAKFAGGNSPCCTRQGSDSEVTWF